MSEGSASGGKEPVRVHRNHRRDVGQPGTRHLDCLLRRRGTATPFLPPLPVLNVGQQEVDRPGQVFAKRVRIPVAPVGPGLFPRLPLFVRLPHRKAGGQKGAVVIGELKPVLAFDAVKLRVGQSLVNSATAESGQTLRRRNSQTENLIPDHAETVAPGGGDGPGRPREAVG